MAQLPLIPGNAGIQKRSSKAFNWRFWATACAGASGVLFALLMLSAPAQAQDAGLKEGDLVTGKLRLVKTRHPNGTAIIAYQIISDAPKLLAKEDEFCDGPPKLFHIVANDKALSRSLDKNMNKKISVYADNFFCSHTAWHIGDVVVTQWRLKN